MGNILDQIVASKKIDVQRQKETIALDELKQRTAAREPARDFVGAIVSPPPRGIHLIAEIKRRSPSAGLIREDFDPVKIARVYESCGASAISVLTERAYFEGDIAYIRQVREVVSLPVLRKDFIIDPYQIWEARAADADAVLLIAEVLGAERVCEFSRLIGDLGMTVLVEAYQPELMRAVLAEFGDPLPAHILIGINNRDLTRQVTDLSTTQRLASLMTDHQRLVSESGIATRQDVLFVQSVGARAMLVGEAIMSSDDMARRISELMGTG